MSGSELFLLYVNEFGAVGISKYNIISKTTGTT